MEEMQRNALGLDARKIIPTPLTSFDKSRHARAAIAHKQHDTFVSRLFRAEDGYVKAIKRSSFLRRIMHKPTIHEYVSPRTTQSQLGSRDHF